MTAGSECKECPAGTYNDERYASSESDCKGCSVGKYSSETLQKDETSCTECPVGTYGDQTASTKCNNCPVGQFNSETGQSGCSDCPAGTFGDEEALSSCKVCPVGQFTIEEGTDSENDCVPSESLPCHTIDSTYTNALCVQTCYLDGAWDEAVCSYNIKDDSDNYNVDVMCVCAHEDDVSPAGCDTLVTRLDCAKEQSNLNISTVDGYREFHNRCHREDGTEPLRQYCMQCCEDY